MGEPREVLRRYCVASGCRIYKAILAVKENDEMRLFCSEDCHAYKFNRWINMAGLKIKKKSPSEVYNRGRSKGQKSISS